MIRPLTAESETELHRHLRLKHVYRRAINRINPPFYVKRRVRQARAAFLYEDSVMLPKATVTTQNQIALNVTCGLYYYMV